ncbi:MAG TPA: metallophosphoesterase [Casimicrobiaceae bacterium]
MRLRIERRIGRARGRRACARALATTCCALVGACAPLATPPGGGVAIQAAFVVLGEEGRPMARAITSAAGCPVLVADGSLLPMTMRAPAATLPLRPTRSAPQESKPSAFPVQVCEATLPAGAIRASIGDRALPIVKAEPRRIVVIGDTGCRMKSSDRVFQACNDTAAWPFAQVAAAAAAAAPDLVIHVGDYHYRENACPPDNAGCAGSPWGYGWDAWNADLFTPAQPLLAAAPWIVVRGNHESCDRAGQGWWRFLDPRPLVPDRDCNDPARDEAGDYSEPYTVPIAADTELIVFDSSRVGIDRLAVTDPMYRTYTAQMRQAFALAGRKPGTHNLFMNHHPILAFAPDSRTQPAGLYPGNQSLHSVLQPINAELLFPKNVDALLSGHVHLFEMVSYATAQPTQIVSGNGGSWADLPLPRDLPPGATPAPGAVVESIVTTDRYGYLTLERDAEGSGAWRIQARDREGRMITTCSLRDRKTRCIPEALP